jgi:hypothetical protein
MPRYAPISLPLHVGLDYTYAISGFLAPWLFGYSQHTGATIYTLALAAFGLGLNLVTDNPGGLFKLLPFRWHQWVEWATPGPFIIVPWMFFADAGAMPWALTAVGLAILLNSALTREVQD